MFAYACTWSISAFLIRDDLSLTLWIIINNSVNFSKYVIQTFWGVKLSLRFEIM